MPSDRPAIAPPAPPAGPRSATAEPPISAAEPGAGATPSATCSRCRPSIRRGSTPCPTTSRKAPPPRPFRQSASSISASSRRSSRPGASAAIEPPADTAIPDHPHPPDPPPPGLPAWVHRHLPRPSLRATPRALRYGRGSLLCTTRISPILRSQRGRDWTRKGGHVWTRIDTPLLLPHGSMHAALHFFSDGLQLSDQALGLRLPLDHELVPSGLAAVVREAEKV